MSTSAPEYLTSLRTGFTDAVQQWMDQSTTAWDQWSQAWSPVMEAAGLGMPSAPGTTPGTGPGRRLKGGHHHGGKDCGCGGSGSGCREQGAHHGDWAGSRDCGCGGHFHHDEDHHDEDHHGMDHHGMDHHGMDQVGERRHHHDGCGCRGRCGCGDVCDCCVPEADVIVRARAGEVRVVPFRLHNPWRREREVSLEVGPWHGCSGDGLEIRAVLEEAKVVLAPCEDRVVRLLISTRGTADDGTTSTGTTSTDTTGTDTTSTDTTTGVVGKDGQGKAPAEPAKPAVVAGVEPVNLVVGTRARTTDVDSCASAYADVRFEGCARPQRVAVVVLPAECDAVDVGCDCGCCC